MKEKFKLVDSIELVHKNKNGKILSRREYPLDYSLIHKLLIKLGLRHNSITKVGMEEVAKLITADVGGVAFEYIGIGTDNTAANNAQTELGAEVANAAATGTVEDSGIGVNDTSQLVHVFSAANDGLSGTDVICEVAVFNDEDTMLLRQVYSPADSCNWDAGDTLQVTVKTQVKQGS